MDGLIAADYSQPDRRPLAPIGSERSPRHRSRPRALIAAVERSEGRSWRREQGRSRQLRRSLRRSNRSSARAFQHSPDGPRPRRLLERLLAPRVALSRPATGRSPRHSGIVDCGSGQPLTQNQSNSHTRLKFSNARHGEQIIDRRVGHFHGCVRDFSRLSAVRLASQPWFCRELPHGLSP